MGEKDDDPASGNWHLDKRIPIALILALVGHAGATIWWGADITARLSQVERMQQASAPQVERIIRLETRMEGIADRLVEIRNILQQREMRP
jgi:hypothetical protein